MIPVNKGVLAVEPTLFTNEVILSWLQYFSQNVDINLAQLKMLDITGKNKNLIPTVMCNRAVLVFTDAGHPDIFYDMWNADFAKAAKLLGIPGLTPANESADYYADSRQFRPRRQR